MLDIGGWYLVLGCLVPSALSVRLGRYDFPVTGFDQLIIRWLGGGYTTTTL